MLPGCCRLREKLARKHGAALKMMKWSIQPPEFGQTWEEYSYDVLQNIPLQLDPAPRDSAYIVTGWNPRIFMAQMHHPQKDKDLTPSLSEKFYRSMTNQGIGYTFNAEAFTDLYKDGNPYSSLFAEIMNPQPNHIHGIPYNVQHVQESGPKAASKIVIQLSEYISEFEHFIAGIDRDYFPPEYAMCISSTGALITISVFSEPERSFKLSVHSPNEVPNMRNNYVTLKAGYEYLILITPSGTESDENIRSIDVEKRECYFADEFNSTDLFKNYTESGNLIFYCGCSITLS